jgi:hypothetical protein
MTAFREPTINVVVTCSNRKSASVASTLLVRNLCEGSNRTRSKEWVNRLKAWKGDRFPARDLYQGDHWAVVRSLLAPAKASSGVQVNVWIASAGCGLISPSSMIPAYGATFAGRNADSVVARREFRREWWQSLADLRWDGERSPNSVAEVAARYPEAPFLIAGSPEYLDAMADDLARAKDLMSDPSRLIVLCREGALSDELNQNKVHTSACLASQVGGSLTSLNARLTKWLIGQSPESLNVAEASRRIEKLRRQTAPRQILVRRKATDEQIKAYVAGRLRTGERMSGSAALVDFRHTGQAAEQSRFNRLFRAVQEEVSFG